LAALSTSWLSSEEDAKKKAYAISVMNGTTIEDKEGGIGALAFVLRKFENRIISSSLPSSLLLLRSLSTAISFPRTDAR